MTAMSRLSLCWCSNKGECYNWSCGQVDWSLMVMADDTLNSLLHTPFEHIIESSLIGHANGHIRPSIHTCAPVERCNIGNADKYDCFALHACSLHVGTCAGAKQRAQDVIVRQLTNELYAKHCHCNNRSNRVNHSHAASSILVANE